MTYTLSMICEVLKSYRGSPHITQNEMRAYRGVMLLPEDGADMEKDILYVCRLTEALKRGKTKPGHHYLCIRDRFWDADETEDFLNGIIVISENNDVPWLFNLVQQRCLQLAEWESQMQQAIIDDSGYQRLLDISEPLLRNFTAVLDSTYKLLAYTRNLPNDDPINIELVKTGYHSEETIKLFQSRKRFKLYDEAHGLIISPPGEISSRYECVSRWCRYGGVNMLHAVMVCSSIPLSSELTELFNILMKYIEIVFLKEQKQLQTPFTIYSSFISDMLYGDLTSPHLIAEQAKRVDIPYSGGLSDVYRIVFEDNAIVLIGRFVQELSSYLPRSKIISKDYEICVLNIYSADQAATETTANLEKITPLLEKYKALCGVSEKFSTLPELRDSFLQASRAQGIGYRLYNLGIHWSENKDIAESFFPHKNGRVFYYNDIFIYYMIYLGESGRLDAFKNTPYIRAIEALQKYDKEHDGNLVEILYCYLMCERRATAAGNLLHMHRNNVLYHIGRITEITGTDLDDYWVRLKLMIAFHYLEFKAATSD